MSLPPGCWLDTSRMDEIEASIKRSTQMLKDQGITHITFRWMSQEQWDAEQHEKET